MKILFLHSSSDLYGASKILLAVTQLCKEQEHQVTVVLTDAGILSDQLLEMGVEVLFIDLAILRRQYFSFSGIINRTITIYKAYHALLKLCSEQHFELIYSNTTAVIVGHFVSLKMKTKHIWHIHEIIEKPNLLFRALSFLLNHPNNRIITVSKSVQQHWSKYVTQNKMEVLYNGVEYWKFDERSSNFRESLQLPSDAIVIGMVGRVHFWKGQDYFFRIAAELHKQFPNLFFVSVGDPFPGYEYLYQNLESIIDAEGLKKSVRLVPFQSNISKVYNTFDLFVLPSQLPDPAPLVVSEAMASGLPVIATHQGGTVEIIENGISGILIPLNDAKEAARKMIPLITDDTARKKMGEAARERVELHFSRKIFNQKIIEFIEQH
jgi:glycosyltransferase involved in cell wall biosynthesis